MQAVVNWLQFDWEVRKEHTTSLLRKIRLGLVPQDNLQELCNSDIGSVEECRAIMEEVLLLKGAGESSTEGPLSHRYPQWFATRNTISVSVTISHSYTT